MPQGKKLEVDYVFTTPGLPFAPIDNMISSGTLISLDMATAMPSVLPASGSLLPNQAVTQCKALMGGVGDVNTLSPTLIYNNNARASTTRTTKGGLEGLVSAVALTSGDGFLVRFPDPVKQYLITNKAHTFYASAHYKVLRAGTGNSSDYLGTRTSGSTDRFFALGRGTDNPASAPKLVGTGKTPTSFSISSGLGDVRRAKAFTGQEGSDILTISALSLGFRVGFHGNNFGGSSTGQPCHILYFIYLEDLTVSGRTFDDIDAMDDEFFKQRMVNTNGKYYNDTFVAASTLP